MRVPKTLKRVFKPFANEIVAIGGWRYREFCNNGEERRKRVCLGTLRNHVAWKKNQSCVTFKLSINSLVFISQVFILFLYTKTVFLDQTKTKTPFS